MLDLVKSRSKETNYNELIGSTLVDHIIFSFEFINKMNSLETFKINFK